MIFGGRGGNSSVVECDLAKVEVAGSNPVSRSINAQSFVDPPPYPSPRGGGGMLSQAPLRPSTAVGVECTNVVADGRPSVPPVDRHHVEADRPLEQAVRRRVEPRRPDDTPTLAKGDGLHPTAVGVAAAL